MAAVLCPSCRLTLEIPPELAGQQVACPKCGGRFISPGGTPPVTSMAPAPSPTFQPPPVFPEPSARTALSQAASSGVPERAASLLDLFDLSFKRYVTPLIVKITWLLTLTLAGLWLTVTVVLLVFSLLPSEDEKQPTAPARTIVVPRRAVDRSVHLDFGQGVNMNQGPDESDFATLGMLVRIVYLASQVIGVVLMLLWVRVVLESVIVVFNIAASLRSIDRKTRGSPA
jgi:hypothetical protein